MEEVRFHGRGGQGAVTAANILATAAFKEGKYVQSFPMFGTERRGAPVAAFVRMSDKPIRVRFQVYEPDIVVVLDPGLLEAVDVGAGLRKDGGILINTEESPEEFSFGEVRVATVDATKIALEHGLGSKAAPIVNTAILGAYAKVSEELNIGKVSLASIVEAVREGAPAKKEENVAATKEAYGRVVL
ncbi:MAG: 2-oxoacid:acceptor oxidoreductase family protein [Hadesarchaea archaeon]|nr:2-oxoacid:acceptor oxidoreductase family protein [Hadesarchaea archaeon]